MINILNSYLVQHKSIGIPGLGTIFMEPAPAQADVETQRLLPPVFRYRFDKFQDAPVKEFFPFVAEQMDVAEWEAIRLYNEFAASLRTEIRQYDQAVWEDLGIFRKDENGEIYFEQFPKRFQLFEPVDLSRWGVPGSQVSEPAGSQEQAVLEDIPEYRLGQEEEAGAKNRWWVYALIVVVLLFVVAAGLHFYTHGGIWQHLTR